VILGHKRTEIIVKIKKGRLYLIFRIYFCRESKIFSLCAHMWKILNTHANSVPLGAFAYSVRVGLWIGRYPFFFFFVISDSITLLSLGGESLASILQHLQMTGAAFIKNRYVFIKIVCRLCHCVSSWVAIKKTKDGV
jgi:hypothetical protein